MGSASENKRKQKPDFEGCFGLQNRFSEHVVEPERPEPTQNPNPKKTGPEPALWPPIMISNHPRPLRHFSQDCGKITFKVDSSCSAQGK